MSYLPLYGEATFCKTPGPGAYSPTSTWTNRRTTCGVSYGCSKADRFRPMMHAPHFDVASTNVARPRGTGELGPASYHVPVDFAPPLLSARMPAQDDHINRERRKATQVKGPDVQSRYETSTKWTIPKSGFLAKRNFQDEPRGSPRIAPKVPHPSLSPGPADYNAATAMSWGKRTLPDSTARGLLLRNGALEESPLSPTPDLGPDSPRSLAQTWTDKSPRNARGKKSLGESGVRDCGWFASSSHYEHIVKPSHSPRPREMESSLHASPR